MGKAFGRSLKEMLRKGGNIQADGKEGR